MKKSLVIMIHGFTGGECTWKNSKNISFKEMLLSNKEISNEYDIVEFDYFTQVLNFKNSIASKTVVNIINKIPLINIRTPKRKKNVSILDLSEELETYIKYNAYNYKSVLFVTHSMGGLIAKKLMLDVFKKDAEIDNVVSGYISLATPHKGSLSAVILGPFNINAKELSPLNKSVNEVNDQWVDRHGDLPDCIYVIAKNDELVSDVSAVPNANKKKFRSERIDEDHTSISKPEDLNSMSFKIVERFLIDISIKNHQVETFNQPYNPSSDSFDKEIFVVKMILAEVNDKLIDDAKESFFYADILLKKAPRKERECFVELSNRIVSLYKTLSACTDHLDSSEVVKNIHESIILYDKTSLECIINYVTFVHKKGFLHREANKNDLTVNWSDSVTVDGIKEEIEKCND